MSFHLIDEENITFQPQTANECIILFNRLRRKGMVHWDSVPALFQNLSRNLDAKEHDKFCEWIVNPYDVKPPPDAESEEEKSLVTSDLTRSVHSNPFGTVPDSETESTSP